MESKLKTLLPLSILLALITLMLSCSHSPTPTPIPSPTVKPAATATPGPTEIPYHIENLKAGSYEIPITPKSDSTLQIKYSSTTAPMTVVVADQTGKIYFSGGSTQGSGIATLKAGVTYTLVIGIQNDGTVQYRLVAPGTQ